MNRKYQAAFIITGIFIGILLITQLKSVVPVDSSFPLDQYEAQKELIKGYLDDQAVLKSQIVSLREEIEKTQQKNAEISKTTNLEILENLKENIGLTAVKGTGIEIVLDDSPSARRESLETVTSALVQASDLRDIVNLLRATKSEAIAINNQRVINTTPVTSVGNSILVNNFQLAPPFTISAVTDAEILLPLLYDENLLPDLYKRKTENGLVFNVSAKNHITIPIYNGDFRLKYIENETTT